MTTKRITSSEVYTAFDLLCDELGVANAKYTVPDNSDYLMINNESPAGTEKDRRYYIDGNINGRTVTMTLHGSGNAYETLRAMKTAAHWGKLRYAGDYTLL